MNIIQSSNINQDFTVTRRETLASKGKQIVLFFCVCIVTMSCSKRDDFDRIISNEYKKCDNKSNCIVDLSVSMNFEWDTMCYFSVACSLEEINRDLGFELKQFTDIGDRVIFLNKGVIVYQKEWFPYPSTPVKGTIFVTSLKYFKVSCMEAKFFIKKEGSAYYLKKV